MDTYLKHEFLCVYRFHLGRESIFSSFNFKPYKFYFFKTIVEIVWGEAKTSLCGVRGTFILEGFSEYKDVAFTARSPYLLVECCPGPITSNTAAIPQFQ